MIKNEDKFILLRQDVSAWNQWRNEHPDEDISLIEARLGEADLRGADLRGVELCGARLGEADLRGANLNWADLRGADLHKTDLRGAHLNEVNLKGTRIDETTQIDHKWKLVWEIVNQSSWHRQKRDLSEADLSEANLSEADLSEANLSEADLRGTNLRGTNLRGTNLRKAYLRGAYLRGADLRGADLHGVELCGADLGETDLCEANLHGADLRFTQLSRAILNHATLTGAYLYGTARDDWKIDCIICDYVYWDDKPYFKGYTKKQERRWRLWGLAHRTPKDRDFRPGEFEELYKQLPTFEYIFEHGITLIDIATINQIVNDIKDLHPDWELKIDSFHSRGQPHANFTIREKDLIAQAFTQIKTNYEETLNKLKGQYEASNRILLRFMRELTDRPQLVLTGDIIVGDKNIGRDNIDIGGQAQVNQLTTGNSRTDTSDSNE